MPPQKSNFISFDWSPQPIILAAQFYRASSVYGDFSDPLNDAIEKIVIPSINKNFESGGRPPWIPLANATHLRDSYDAVSRKGILWKTGTLKSIATSVAPWQTTNDTAFLMPSSLGEAEYGMFHQAGTKWMPARPWANLQSEDEDAIAESMAGWSAGVIIEIGLFGRALNVIRGLFGRGR